MEIEEIEIFLKADANSIGSPHKIEPVYLLHILYTLSKLELKVDQ